MLTLDDVENALIRLVDAIGPRQASIFVCGDCDRNASCGMAPQGNCAEQASQIARYGQPKTAASECDYSAFRPY
jgi:hypothetical protein